MYTEPRYASRMGNHYQEDRHVINGQGTFNLISSTRSPELVVLYWTNSWYFNLDLRSVHYYLFPAGTVAERWTNNRGEGETQIWFGQGCVARALKPVRIFKGHFGRKGTHFYFSQNNRPMFRDIFAENGTHV